jgi:hypothetical protein
MRRKLSCLGLKTEPYLYGACDDEDEGVRHFERIRELENAAECKYSVFYGSDEWELIAPATALIYERLRVIDNRHPQLMSCFVESVEAKGGGWETDLFCNKINTINRRHFTRHGKDDGKFKIQVRGASSISDIFAFANYSFGEALFDRFKNRDLRIDVFAQWEKSSADNMLRFLQDGLGDIPDLVLFVFGWQDAQDTYNLTKNLLGVRTPANIRSIYPELRDWIGEQIGGVAYGVDFDVDMRTILVMQFRVMNTLAKLYGFELWGCVLPNSRNIPQGAECSARSPGYLKRQRASKDALVAALAEYGEVKDFTDAFDDYDNVFSLLMDEGHMTAKGCAALAKRVARELAKDFPQYVMDTAL